MSMLQYRGSIGSATLLVALLSSIRADAQFVGPGPVRESGTLVNEIVTGVEYDRLNKAKAERQIQHLQEKLRRDAANCQRSAVDHDLRRIDNLNFRIAVDVWLIRKNSLCDPGPYPFLADCLPLAAIADASRPAEIRYPPQIVSPPLPMGLAPTITVTIANTEPTGPGLGFAINGMTYQAEGGSRRDLAVPPNATISFDAGGLLGQRRYQLSPGTYEFRPNGGGWAFYRMPNNP